MKYKVYEISPKLSCYRGLSLVATESAEKANQIIRKFINDDPNNNMDSWGYSYVAEYNIIEGLYSEQEGIVHMGIYYYG